MRAILIDAYAKEIREVEFTGDFMQVYELLSNSVHEVNLFAIVRLNQYDGLFVDDEGLPKAEERPDETRFFTWRGFHQPIVGNGLILASDDTGECIPSSMPLDQVREHVSFPDLQFIGWTPPEPPRTIETIFGPALFISGGAKPIFGPRSSSPTSRMKH